jgi:PKD repeat protein
VTLKASNAYGESRVTKTVSVVSATGTPSITGVTRQYPGVFLQAGNFTNQFDVTVDWQGSPGKVTFSVNSAPALTETGTRTGASHVFNMATDIPVRWAPSSITIIATNGSGIASAPVNQSIHVFPYPVWLDNAVATGVGHVTVSTPGNDVWTNITVAMPSIPSTYIHLPNVVPVFGGDTFGFGAEASLDGDVHSSSGLGTFTTSGKISLSLFKQSAAFSGTGDGTFTLREGEGLRISNGTVSYRGTFHLQKSFNALTEWVGGKDELERVFGTKLGWFFAKGLDWLSPLEVKVAVDGSAMGVAQFSSDPISQQLFFRNDRYSITANASAVPSLGWDWAVEAKAFLSGSVEQRSGFQSPAVQAGSLAVYAGLAIEPHLDLFASGCAFVQINCSWATGQSPTCSPGGLQFASECLRAESGQNPAAGSSVNGQANSFVRSPNYSLFGDYCVLNQNVARAASTATAPSGAQSTQALLNNVFPGASPQRVALASGDLLLWVQQNTQLPPLQSTDIAWSAQQGGVWSAPALVSQDTRAEFEPRVALDRTGHAVATWLRIKSPTFSADTSSPQLLPGFHQELEVVSAIFDPAARRWSEVTQLTNDQDYDFDLTLASDSAGNMLLAWLSDPNADIFSANPSPIKVKYTFWDGSKWAAPTTLAGGLTGAIRHAAAIQGNRAFVVVDRIPGQGSSGAETLEAYSWDGSRWAGPVNLGGTGSTNRLPACAFDHQGSGHVVWVQGDDLVHATLSRPTPEVIRPGSASIAWYGPQLLSAGAGNLAVIWANGALGGSSQLLGALFDPIASSWSCDVVLASTPGRLSGFQGYFGADGVIHGTCLDTTVDLATRTLDTDLGPLTLVDIPQEGQTDICLLEHSLGKDLAVGSSDIVVDPRHPVAGDSLTATLSVHNAGDFEVGAFDVDFYFGAPESGGVLLGSTRVLGPTPVGASQVATLRFMLPPGNANLVAIVDQRNEIAEFTKANNRATWYLTNRPPIARFVADVTAGQTPLTVSFDASASIDPDGDSMVFNLTFADGSAGVTGLTTTHLFAAPGSYPVTLVATDSHGAVGTVTVMITVLGDGHRLRRRLAPGEGACTAPSITAQPQSQSISSGQTTTLSVTASGTAPLHYQWYQGSVGDTSHPVGIDSPNFTTPALTATTSYWVGVSNACGQANSAAGTIAVAGGGISGRVTLGGLPIGGIGVSLVTSTSSAIASATTLTDGSYQFNGVATLASGSKYWVEYQNSQTNPKYLFYCFSASIASYKSGASVQVADLDITNVVLTSPVPGAAVSLPQQFSWQLRPATPSDSYYLALFDPNNQATWISLGPLGYVGNHTLFSLPHGFTDNTPYGWYVYFYASDGSGGVSCYYNPITFVAP